MANDPLWFLGNDSSEEGSQSNMVDNSWVLDLIKRENEKKRKRYVLAYKLIDEIDEYWEHIKELYN